MFSSDLCLSYFRISCIWHHDYFDEDFEIKLHARIFEEHVVVQYYGSSQVEHSNKLFIVAVGSIAGLCGQWKSCGEAQGRCRGTSINHI